MACREIDLIVIHCSVTHADRCFMGHGLETAHRHREFNGCGYHSYIHKNRDIKTMRPTGRIGAHARDCNAHSVDICYEGGSGEEGRPADTRTGWQCHSLRMLMRTLPLDYPGYRICGYRDLSPNLNGNGEIEPEKRVKQYPCFEVSKERW